MDREPLGLNRGVVLADQAGAGIFPRVDQCGSFLDEFAVELAEYDDITRTVRYTHPDGMQDDAVHATNYALLVALRSSARRKRALTTVTDMREDVDNICGWGIVQSCE